MSGQSDRCAVRSITITAREAEVFGGRSFGAVGPYELIAGTAVCEADPAHPLNGCIALLDQAPRDAAGLVRYEVDLCLLKPMDAARGNGWLLTEVLNRGAKRGIVRINDAPPVNWPNQPGHEGNGYLMREGYAVAWVGWQGDVPRSKGRMAGAFPVVPAHGTVREEFIVDAPGSVRDELTEEIDAGRFIATLTWPAASLDPARATLTARQQERDPRAVPAGLSFRFVDDRHIEITRPTAPGFDRGTIFEFIYEARESAVMGLGMAALRDVSSFLAADAAAGDGTPNPLAGAIRHAILFGLSQSGRVIKDFLHHGFNRDPRGRTVFDVAMPVIAGSRRSNVLWPHAQPGRYSRQHEDHAYGDDQFPFSYPTLHDPVSGRTDGVLARLRALDACPKVLHVDTDSEMWSARASLVATGPDGADIAMPEDVRIYMASGLQHGSYGSPDLRVVSHDGNPLHYGTLVRPLLAAARAWVEQGVPPPPSRFPSRAEGTLVPHAEAQARFPRIPGVAFPARLNELSLMDYRTEPPTEGPEYPVFLAATDADGTPTGGWRHPVLEAPLGTYTGWNLRRPGYAGGALYSIAGSFIPFAKTRAEREAAGDSRPSLEERYGTHAAWKARLAAACADLVAQRLLLEEDRDRLLAAAGDSWETTRVHQG